MLTTYYASRLVYNKKYTTIIMDLQSLHHDDFLIPLPLLMGTSTVNGYNYNHDKTAANGRGYYQCKDRKLFTPSCKGRLVVLGDNPLTVTLPRRKMWVLTNSSLV